MVLHLLYEHASGFAVFRVNESEEIGGQSSQQQQAVSEWSLFSRCCALVAFRAFASAEEALDNVLQLSEGQATPLLLDTLAAALPRDATLGVGEERLAVSIVEHNKAIKCEKNLRVAELLRGCRLHFAKFVGLAPEEANKAQLGLGHSYSRSKVKFNVNRVDNMIIQRCVVAALVVVALTLPAALP